MELLHKIVVHKMLGHGTICAVEGSLLKIQFESRTANFQFPSAFEKFLKFQNPNDQALIIEQLNHTQAKNVPSHSDYTSYVVAPNILHEKKTSTRISKVRKTTRNNIAFKCNFCDGGCTKTRLGYSGVCSDQIIDYNINVAKHSWCKDDSCYCSQYLRGELDGNTLDQIYHSGGFTCYESAMLRDWAAYAGTNLPGLSKNKKETPRKIKDARTGNVALLTTRKPYAQEKDRFIFGIFLIDEAEEGDWEDAGWVRSHSKYRIELTPQEAQAIKFWNYHANSKCSEKPRWGTGLYRYIDDVEVLQILRDVIALKQNQEDREFIEEFVQQFCLLNGIVPGDIPPSSGALHY